jgi:hypothetical protein
VQLLTRAPSQVVQLGSQALHPVFVVPPQAADSYVPASQVAQVVHTVSALETQAAVW